MTLLDPAHVLSSDVVANSTMNRGRGRTGVNSYARELGFDPLDRLTAYRATNGHAAWCDACCGEGHALLEAHDAIRRTPDRDGYEFFGADLIGQFPATSPDVSLVVCDVSIYQPGVPVDLMTCVHGVHYLGDNLGFLEHAYRLLAPGGRFVGHLDLANIRMRDAGSPTWSELSRVLRRSR